MRDALWVGVSIVLAMCLADWQITHDCETKGEFWRNGSTYICTVKP